MPRYNHSWVTIIAGKNRKWGAEGMPNRKDPGSGEACSSRFCNISPGRDAVVMFVGGKLDQRPRPPITEEPPIARAHSLVPQPNQGGDFAVDLPKL